MHVVFRAFHGFAGQHALALLVNLEHVPFGLLPVPAKNDLEHMGHIIHEIDRVVPADDQPARFEVRLRAGLFFLVNVR